MTFPKRAWHIFYWLFTLICSAFHFPILLHVTGQCRRQAVELFHISLLLFFRCHSNNNGIVLNRKKKLFFFGCQTKPSRQLWHVIFFGFVSQCCRTMTLPYFASERRINKIAVHAGKPALFPRVCGVGALNKAPHALQVGKGSLCDPVWSVTRRGVTTVTRQTRSAIILASFVSGRRIYVDAAPRSRTLPKNYDVIVRFNVTAHWWNVRKRVTSTWYSNVVEAGSRP